MAAEQQHDGGRAQPRGAAADGAEGAESAPPERAEGSAGSGPLVSVILPVHNSMPYLTECLESLFAQTIGVERLEVLAVDDGSTDDSGAELDRWAERHPQLRVTRRDTASGGAGLPRNLALARATGRFVFFLDADDVLGPDTLRRLVAMAEKQDTELVVGKVVALGGRSVSTKAFRHDPRVDLRTSEVFRSGLPQKLFRRELLEREELRFHEDIWNGEDQIFVTEAYLAARGISVVGDYDCYFLRQRDDGGNLTLRPRRPGDQIGHTERVMPVIAERAEDPLVRSRMLARHFRFVAESVLLGAVSREDGYRAELWGMCLDLYRAHWSAEMRQELSAYDFLALECLVHGNERVARELADWTPENAPGGDLVDGGRVYRRFPGLRSPAGLPDASYDVTDRLTARAVLEAAEWSGDSLLLTGHGYIDWLDTADPASELVLRHRDGGRELRLPLEPRPSPDLAELRGHPCDYGRAGWRAVLDVAAADAGAALAPGVWDASVLVGSQGMAKERRLSCPPAAEADRRPGAFLPGVRMPALPGGPDGAAAGPVPVVPYVTKGNAFSLDVGAALRPLRAGAEVTEVRWDGAPLELTAVAWVTEVAAGDLSAELVLRARQGADEPSGPAEEVTVRAEAVPGALEDALRASGGAGPAVPAVAAPAAFRAVVDPGRVPAGVWDLFLRLPLPHREFEVRLTPAESCGRACLGESHWHRGTDGKRVWSAPYVTKGGYLALDSGGSYFPPPKDPDSAGADGPGAGRHDGSTPAPASASGSVGRKVKGLLGRFRPSP